MALGVAVIISDAILFCDACAIQGFE
jgi:hypothetical protein